MQRKMDCILAGLSLALALPVTAAFAQTGFREVTAPPQSQAQGSTPAAKPRPIAEPVNRSEGSELAGRYAILREGGKDVGCLLTLDSAARGPQGSMKAQLAPACRDQGIVIFDPIGWSMERGQLLLIARKGHSAKFERHQDGAWWKDAKDGGKPLGIRKI